MSKTLITGANGLVGTYLIRELLGSGEHLIGLYRSALPANLLPEELNKVEWVQGDILDVSLLSELMTQCDRVYHCAGLVSFNPRMATTLMKVNVEGTANVVNAALGNGIKKLVHVSSVAAIGRKRNNETVSEETKWDDASNPSVYGESKYLGELEVWRGHAEGLNVAIVNPVIILGIGDWSHGSSATFKSAYNEFPWYTDGISGFVDAADVAKAMVELMKSDISGQRYILSAENKSYREVFTQMAIAFGKKPPHRKVTPVLASIAWRIEKIKALFSGNEPMLTKETAETAQQKVYFDNSKILKALPGFSFKSVTQSIQDACTGYINYVLPKGN
jgi:nucleoside-diphosphate-sugar epimerase